MDNNNNNIDDDANFQGARQPILLNEEGRQLFSILESYINSELPPYTNSKMNEMLNNMAAAEGKFVSTVRTSVVDLFFRDGITDEQRGLTTTIIDKKEWPKEEKRYETALRLFPDILSEQQHGVYPIQWLVMQETDKTYNLKSVSLIPIVTKMGIELQQLDEELRGGLLSLYPSGRNTIQNIICYHTKGDENNELRDDCFSTVRNRMRENKYLLIEDIRRFKFVAKLFSTNAGLSIESRLQYLINMYPVTLSLPCRPKSGNMVPIHWSTAKEGIGAFNLVLKMGMQHYPEKFGFVFSEGTVQYNDGKFHHWTPFQQACYNYGQENVINEVINRITEYSTSAFTSISTSANNVETSLLMSAITNETIHIDGLYILLRRDPVSTLMRLQQKLLPIVEEVHTVTDTNSNSSSNTNTNTNTNTNITNSSNNKNTNTNTNMNTNIASNNNGNAAMSCVFNSTSSLILTTDTVAVAAGVFSSTSTANNYNNNNNDDNCIHIYNRDNGNALHQPSSSSPNLKGKKRKHKMR